MRISDWSSDVCSSDLGDVALADDVQIGPYCVLRNVKLGAGTIVNAHSVLEGCDAGADCVIGPFARVRPTTQLAAGAHIGNFVEVKNATLGESTTAKDRKSTRLNSSH